MAFSHWWSFIRHKIQDSILASLRSTTRINGSFHWIHLVIKSHIFQIHLLPVSSITEIMDPQNEDYQQPCYHYNDMHKVMVDLPMDEWFQTSLAYQQVIHNLSNSIQVHNWQNCDKSSLSQISAPWYDTRSIYESRSHTNQPSRQVFDWELLNNICRFQSLVNLYINKIKPGPFGIDHWIRSTFSDT